MFSRDAPKLMQYAGFLMMRFICIIYHIYPTYLQQSILNKIINVAYAFNSSFLLSEPKRICNYYYYAFNTWFGLV